MIDWSMSGDTDEDLGDATGVAVLSLIFGLLVQVFFNALTQGQDAGVFLLVLVGFTACILYGEVNLSFPSGLTFGIGMLPTSFFAQDWWLVGLGVAAAATNLAKYALTDSDDIGPRLESSIHPEDSGF
jgi:ribose/xylose/arabinose/galactoside ABC-type transport system permease subunit